MFPFHRPSSPHDAGDRAGSSSEREKQIQGLVVESAAGQMLSSVGNVQGCREAVRVRSETTDHGRHCAVAGQGVSTVYVVFWRSVISIFWRRFRCTVARLRHATIFLLLKIQKEQCFFSQRLFENKILN